ncbi:OLC1v1007924C1 [Oldenlandia corymbosa var. corymbosa]|uniref:OLC1v1007924C1 n=1 Tax=Oldenlandia corymbosa var. corymbosa TaxID=529605 RepID=A0AAV1DMU4_OLDCO|nr:OLC1v1007924C1 [Oldenlandia corymbosa var. corymbosa]
MVNNSSSSTANTAEIYDHRHLQRLLEELCYHIKKAEEEIPSEESQSRLSKFLDELDKEKNTKHHYRHEIEEMKKQWIILNVFVYGVKIWSTEVAEVLESCGSAVAKIEAKGDELAKLIITLLLGYQESSITWMMKMVDDLLAKGAELPELNREIAGVVPCFFMSFSSKHNYSHQDLNLLGVYQHLVLPPETKSSFIHHVNQSGLLEMMLSSWGFNSDNHEDTDPFTAFLIWMLEQFYVQIPKFDFSNKSADIGFFDSLVRDRLEPSNLRHISQWPVEKNMGHIRRALISLRPYIEGALKEQLELSEPKHFRAYITKMMYDLECIMDLAEVKIGPHWQHVLWTYNLYRQIILIETMVEGAKLQKMTDEDGGQHIPVNLSTSEGLGKRKTEKPVLYLHDQEELIIDRLMGRSSQRDVVSIVGMPGLGKTTVAKKVYDDPRVSYHFKRRAWCCVPQTYVKRDLLLQLLGDIQGHTDEIHDMEDASLELKLRQCLRRKRYLVVFDNVWDIGAWEAVKASFLDDRNGSRIMLISCVHQVALDAMPSSTPHQLRPLSGDESWKLLETRIFREEGCCPEELVQVGKKIAELCKGVPLAVVVVAGMLEKTEKKQESWQQILEELNTRVNDDPESQCKSILEMSYNHLPHHLKACFLYFGMFQPDKDVHVRKLLQMWIAEGLIHKTDEKSLDEVAEDAVMELIDRGLLIIVKRKSRGGVKSCRMHVLFNQLCLSNSKAENSLGRIIRYDETYASFDKLYPGVDFEVEGPLNIAKFEAYHICVHLKRQHFSDSRPSGRFARSLIYIATDYAHPEHAYKLSFRYKNFKLLRLLDLECINMGSSFPSEILILVLLRYLSVTGNFNYIPGMISDLRKLETFIVKGLSGIELPFDFWCMKSLRHVHIKSEPTFQTSGDLFWSSETLDNLLTFSSTSAFIGKFDANNKKSYSKTRNIIRVLRKFPNLQKLRCAFYDSEYYSETNCNKFPALDHLIHLQSLNIMYAGSVRSPAAGGFSLPLNLRKLTLSRFYLSGDQMSSIGRLPNLEVLKLISATFQRQTWDMNNDEFCKLKFLKLHSSNVIQWNAASNHLPKLEQLFLWNCKDLEDVPYGFSEIPTLQIIEVKWCSESLQESIRYLEESIEGLQVLISH